MKRLSGQAGCAGVVVACCTLQPQLELTLADTAAGATFGTVTAGAGTPAIIVGCNSAYGTCQAACWAALALPVP